VKLSNRTTIQFCHLLLGKRRKSILPGTAGNIRDTYICHGRPVMKNPLRSTLAMLAIVLPTTLNLRKHSFEKIGPPYFPSQQGAVRRHADQVAVASFILFVFVFVIAGIWIAAIKVLGYGITLCLYPFQGGDRCPVFHGGQNAPPINAMYKSYRPILAPKYENIFRCLMPCYHCDRRGDALPQQHIGVWLRRSYALPSGAPPR